MMELSLRCRRWTVLQVVAIVVCYRGKVLCDRAQGCVGSQLSLRCPQMRIVQITSIVLGDTKCYGRSCCIKDNDCTHAANANHRTDVIRRCDNKQSCTVGVIQEKIPCGFFSSSNNDFERITYNCVNELQRPTTTTSLRPIFTENLLHTEENTSEKETEKESTTTDFNPFSDDKTSSTDDLNTENFNQNITEHAIIDHDENGAQANQSDNNPRILPRVIPTACLLILIAIVAIVVMMMRRKRNPRGRPDSAAEIMNIDGSDRNEVTITDGNHAMILSNGNGFPIYSNDAIIKSDNKGNRVYENYCVQNNVVYNNVEGYAGCRSAEDPLIDCYMDSTEPVYQVPKPMFNFNSVIKDIGEPECAGSTAEASSKSYNVYCNLKTMEPANTANSNCSKQDGYDETCNRKESECDATKADKSFPMAQAKKKEAENPAHRTATDPYTKVNKPSSNVAITEPSDKVASKDKDGTKVCYPNPIYEEMSPLIPESTYANTTVLSSVASSVIPTGLGSEQENPYCEMK